MNAPPDVLAATEEGKARRELMSLPTALEGKKRLFICGLALDFCVLDTCINARLNGFEEVIFILDASRPAHIPGVGTHGSGFLSDPNEVRKKISDAGVKLASYQSLVPHGTMVTIAHLGQSSATSATFPQALGPLGLEALPKKIDVKVVDGGAKYQFDMGSSSRLAALAHSGVDGTGFMSPRSAIPQNWEEAPPAATSMCWAYPMYGLSHALVSQTDFLEMSCSPELRFVAYGGYLLFDGSGAVVLAQSLTFDLVQYGEDLLFERASDYLQQYIEPLRSANRMQKVTLPALWRLGAREFCWISPGEVLSVAGDEWVPSSTGGFVYVMAAEAAPLLFKVKLNSPDSARRRGTVRPASSKQRRESSKQSPGQQPNGKAAAESSAEREYVESHKDQLEEAITKGVRDAIGARATNPIAHVGRYLSGVAGSED